MKRESLSVILIYKIKTRSIKVGFDKNYPNRKDRRKEYRDSRNFDTTCRCHGSCPYCQNNRLFFDRKARRAAELDLIAYEKDLLDDEPLLFFGYFFNA